jgi:hypothetical protein
MIPKLAATPYSRTHREAAFPSFHHGVAEFRSLGSPSIDQFGTKAFFMQGTHPLADSNPPAAAIVVLRTTIFAGRVDP